MTFDKSIAISEPQNTHLHNVGSSVLPTQTGESTQSSTYGVPAQWQRCEVLTQNTSQSLPSFSLGVRRELAAAEAWRGSPLWCVQREAVLGNQQEPWLQDRPGFNPGSSHWQRDLGQALTLQPSAPSLEK